MHHTDGRRAADADALVAWPQHAGAAGAAGQDRAGGRRGQLNKDIAAELGDRREKTVSLWRKRFAEQRLAGIEKDAPRPGRKPSIPTADRGDDPATRRPKRSPRQPRTGARGRWPRQSGRVARPRCNASGRPTACKPHLVKTFKVSNDPQFAEKLVDVVGLYLNPPEHALVLSVATRRARFRPWIARRRACRCYPGRCGTMTHDYKRNGTTTLVRRPRTWPRAR